MKKENGSIDRGEKKEASDVQFTLCKEIRHVFSKMVPYSQSPFLYDQAPSVADPGEVGGLTPPPSEVLFLACQYMYMKIPADLDSTPPEEFRPRTPPPFLGPPLTIM